MKMKIENEYRYNLRRQLDDNDYNRKERRRSEIESDRRSQEYAEHIASMKL